MQESRSASAWGSPPPPVRAGKGLVALLAALLLALGAATLFPSTAARTAARSYFSEEEIERGLRYSRERRLLSWSSGIAVFLFWSWVALQGWGRRLTDWGERRLGLAPAEACRRPFGRWLLLVLGLGLGSFLGQALVLLPFGIGGWLHQRAWDMTPLTLAGWLREWGRSQLLFLALGELLLLGMYLLLRYFPRSWWLLATLAGTVLALGYALLLPLLIEPLFYHFSPLENADLEQRLQRLAARAGLQVHQVLVLDASRRSRHTNAYFTGFGPTQRIVLYDTLLQRHTPAEIEVILAHELGHWRHQHILKGILLGGLGVGLGLFVLARLLAWARQRPPFLLRGPEDPAGLPLILGFLALSSYLALPVENALSRYFEYQADETALELAGHPEVFLEAEKRLARDNLSDVAPNGLTVCLFYTHPPVLERLRLAEEWSQRPSPKTPHSPGH